MKVLQRHESASECEFYATGYDFLMLICINRGNTLAALLPMSYFVAACYLQLFAQFLTNLLIFICFSYISNGDIEIITLLLFTWHLAPMKNATCSFPFGTGPK